MPAWKELPDRRQMRDRANVRDDTACIRGGQPFVRLALHGRLAARTAKVDRLSQYLGLERDDPVVTAARKRFDRAQSSVRGHVSSVDELLALSDGASEQGEFFLDLRNAVRRLADARSGERSAKEQVGDH